MSYLHFDEVKDIGTTRKTKMWEVTNSGYDPLGLIAFRGAWRKYVFSPHTGTLYDAECLREIADFAEAETVKWRASL